MGSATHPRNHNVRQRLAGILPLLAAATIEMAAPCAHAGTEDDVLFELQATAYGGHGADSPLLATQFYAEKPLPVADLSGFLVVHHDKKFRALYAGLARKFGGLQLGVGFGNAWYDRIRRSAVNPWLYYAGEDVEAYLSAEHYTHDDQAPWYYKGYASRWVTDSFLVGAYGEKDMGAGPMIGWRNAGLRIWLAVPVVSRPEAGARWVAGVQVGF